MLTYFVEGLVYLVLAINLASAVYVLMAIYRVHAFNTESTGEGNFRPAVSVFKPVCGLDVDLYENLATFCRQDYPQFQVIFGLHNASDPALPVVRRIIDENPDRDIALIIDETLSGPNLKVSNLENMNFAAKHDYLLIADSDMRVDDQYLSRVMAPFSALDVGVVTCLYKGTAARGLASILGAMFINSWFLPSVLVSAGMRDVNFGLGATIAVRRSVLDTIGGFKYLAKYLADDHILGKRAHEIGFKVVLSGYVVENVVFEKSISALFRHELRWARTVRTVEPLGHAFSFIMYGIPLALLATLMVDLTRDWGLFDASIIIAAVALRVGMHITVARKFGLAHRDRSFWLVPLRDIMSFVVWAASFFGRNISWKDASFNVDANGLMVTSDVVK